MLHRRIDGDPAAFRTATGDRAAPSPQARHGAWFFSLNYHRALLRCSLCWRIAWTVFLGILAIEAVVLVPSYVNRERDLLQRLDFAGRQVLQALHLNRPGLAPLPPGTVITGYVQFDEAGDVHHRAGEPVGIGLGDESRYVEDGRRYETIWYGSVTNMPYAVAARLDSSAVQPELNAFLMRIAGLVLLISMSVAVATMAVVGRDVLAPLLRLRQNLREAAADPANPDSYLMPSHRGDELGDVFVACNDMLMQVADSRRRDVQRLAAMIDNATEPILACDPTGAITYANGAAAALADGSVRVVPSDGEPLHAADFLRRGAYAGEVELTASDGNRRPFAATVDVLYGDGDGATLYHAALQDISPLVEAHEELRRQHIELAAANRSKSEFLANMSHELRTPLNAIIGFAQMMRDGVQGPLGNPSYTEYATDIAGSGQRLLQVINDVLDMARIETGESKLDLAAVDLSLLVEDVAGKYRERAAKGDLTLDLDADEATPAIEADERKLRQALGNLVSNAIKFTPPGGRVRLSVSAGDAGDARIAVTDSGIGMTEDEVARALTPFGQADSGLDRRYEGSGLGLTLAQALVTLHGGRLTVTSEPGAGTTVTLHLPAAPPA